MARIPSKFGVIIILVFVTVVSVFWAQDYVTFDYTAFSDVSNMTARFLRFSATNIGVLRQKLTLGGPAESSQSLSTVVKMSTRSHMSVTTVKPTVATTAAPNTSTDTNKTDLIAGCKIPHFDPFSLDVMKFVKTLKAPKCTREPQIVFVEGANITVNTALLDKKKETLVSCKYEDITRAAESSAKFSKPVEFFSTARPQADFVRVYCRTKDKSDKAKDYKMLLSIVAEKPELEAVLQNRTAADNTSKEAKRPPLNLVMVGVDSVSRFAMLRQLPVTRHFLLEHLQAVDLINYNKVGVNTFPNILAMMTGISFHSFNPQNIFKSKPIDTLNISFVWNELAGEGYRTMFSEDFPDISIFNFARKGFKDPPAHYYYRTFELAKKSNKDLFSEGGQCYGTWPEDELILNYTMQFQRLFREKRHFAFTFLTRSTHDDGNGPSRIDIHHSRFLSTVHKEGLLNNTLFIFFSDHGIRWGSVRNTKQGPYEDNRPFMYLVFPPWFRKERPDVLKRVQQNAARLITPFDVHATLRDVPHLHLKDFRRERARFNNTGVGISLFDKIPANRTCADAGIPLLFCVCLKNRPLNTTSLLAKQAGTTLVKELNTAMANVTDVCNVLDLKKVDSAVEIEQGWQYVAKHCKDFSKKLTDALLLRLAIFTKPGDGKFEAMMYRCNSTQDFFLYSDIDRTNKYGNTSHCVNDGYLKKMCYCKDLSLSDRIALMSIP